MRNILILFGIFFLLSMPYQSSAETLSSKSNKLNLRTGPGKNHKIKCMYSVGFPVKLLKKQGEWAQVIDFESEVGWVSKQLLSQSPHAIVKVNKGSNNKINVRSGPGTNHPIVGKAYYGVIFAIIGKKGEWKKVRHASGLSGWVQKDLLWGE